MNPSPAGQFCYADWLASAGSLHEGTLFALPRALSEHQLQAHWFAGDFGREFYTISGASVRILQFGVWNHQAGPDFAEAAVSFDNGPPKRGCIELDPHLSDWEHHGHATNPDYESVILHLFVERSSVDFFTRTLTHRLVPQVQLSLERLPTTQPRFVPEARPGRCLAFLQRLPEGQVRALILGAAQYRLRRKANALARLSSIHGSDEALYQALAATLGYARNKLPFTLLAQRLPLRTLLQNPPAAEALLFGISGFLNSTDLGACAPNTRLYLRQLWEDWWPQRAAFERLCLPSDLWKSGGQRPANHPQRRLAALAQLVRSWHRLRRLHQQGLSVELERFFSQLQHPYWEHHFTVQSRTSPLKMALLGRSRISEILLNVSFPWVLDRLPEAWERYQKLPAVLTSRRAKIAATRLFGQNALPFLKFAAAQQGLLQLYEDFCLKDATDCARCPFPEQLGKWTL